MTRVRRLALCAALLAGSPILAGLSSCGAPGDESPGVRWQAVTDTVGDTVRVRTIAGSVFADTATLVAEVSIGSLEAEDEYVIGDPRAIAVAPNGAIYVLDTQVPVLRVYSPDGVHLRDLGRDGQGPGEYESPDGMAVLPDGRILVRDPPNGRITVFGPDGEYAEAWPLSGGFNSSRRFYVDTAGNSYVTTLRERGLPPWEWRFALIPYSPDGVAGDTLPAPTWEYEPARVTASRENSSSSRLVPFSPQEAWSFSPLGYMVGGLSTEYRIDLFPRDGPVLRIERVVEVVPIHRQEAEERVRRITEGLRRQYGSWNWNGPDVPDAKPPFRDLFVSAEGNVWVLVSRPAVATMTESEARREAERAGRVLLRFREPPAFDVFTPDGSYVGHVKAPESLRTRPEPVVIGDHLWGVVRDELDVPSVVRFRIEW